MQIPWTASKKQHVADCCNSQGVTFGAASDAPGSLGHAPNVVRVGQQLPPFRLAGRHQLGDVGHPVLSDYGLNGSLQPHMSRLWR